MAKFYGVSIREVREWTCEDFEGAWQLMPSLKAEETLRMITASCYPNAKKEFRDKTHRELHREMRKFEPEQEEQTIETLAMILQGRK